MSDPVGIGTAVIAYIEPHAGQARAFNAWYERDHFYAAAMAGPGMYAGARWVATRACKAVRPPGALFGDRARGSYLATYWLLPGAQSGWDDWSARAYASMPPERLFADRDHVHTAVYSYVTDARTDAAPAPATALDHGFEGLIAVAASGDAEAVASQLVGPELPLALVLAPERTILTTTDPAVHQLVLGFCTADPLQVWNVVASSLADVPGIGFASPFLRTIPGTDAYVDDL